MPKDTISLCLIKTLFFSFSFAFFAFSSEITCTANKVIATLNKNKTIKEIVIEGNVVFTYKNVKILTDKAYIDPVAHTIFIKGTARFIRKSVNVKARHISYNYKNQTGVFNNAYFSYKPIYGKAEKIIKKGNTYILYNGYVTTCPKKPYPVYRVASKKIRFSYDTKKITARNIKIYIGNTPIFYFPVFSQSATAKKPFIEIRPGYESEIGKTIDLIFNNSSLNLNNSESLNLGTSATEGGWTIENANNKNQQLSANLVERYDGSNPLYGIFGQFQQNFSGGNNVIFDWRDVSDETTFQDYFYKQFIEESENPNYFYYTKTFPSSIFDIGIQNHAGESSLFPDRDPDINYTYPAFNVGNNLWASFNSSFTRFVPESSPATDRAYNSISLEEPFNTFYGKISPFLQLTDIYYYNQSTDMDNFIPQIGVKTDMLFKSVSGPYTDFLSPEFSFYSQYPSEKNVPFNFDLLDYNPSGSFLGAGFSWSRWKGNENIANVLSQNSYDINNNQFQNSIESYNFILNKKVGISGQQIFNFSDGGMTENINTISFTEPHYTLSLGNEFDKFYINALSAGITKKIDSQWRFSVNIYYDLMQNSLNEWSIDIEKKIKCFLVGLTIIKSNVTSVYFTLVPSAFARF